MGTANKIFLALALIDASLFGASIINGQTGLAIAEGFVTLFCALGAVTQWKE